MFSLFLPKYIEGGFIRTSSIAIRKIAFTINFSLFSEKPPQHLPHCTSP